MHACIYYVARRWVWEHIRGWGHEMAILKLQGTGTPFNILIFLIYKIEVIFNIQKIKH